MLVDVSHVSDRRSGRARSGYAPRHRLALLLPRAGLNPRNLTDAELRAIAKNGGMVGITSFRSFSTTTSGAQYAEVNRRLRPEFDSIRAQYGPAGARRLRDRQLRAATSTASTSRHWPLLDHIDTPSGDGCGPRGPRSDFDGISVLPRPMKDATSLPLIARASSPRLQRQRRPENPGRDFLRLLNAAR